MITTDASLAPEHTSRAHRDTRGYWRILLAICAPLGWLTVALGNLLTPYELGGSYQDQVSRIAAHHDLMAGIVASSPVFTFTFLPGVLAVILACRRAQPVFTAVLGTLGVLGALAGIANPPIDLVLLTGLDAGIGQDQLASLAERLDQSPAGLALVFTFVFITLGRIALGVLLWTANAAPRWCAVLMATSPLIEFVPLGGGNVQPALAWGASGIAMLGVSWTLWRMPNDEVDLPPLPRR